MKNSVLFICFLLPFVYSCAQNKSTTNDSKILDAAAERSVEHFFGMIKSDRQNEAIGELLSENSNIDQNDSTFFDLKNKLSAIVNTSGKYLSYRLLKKKNLGDDLAAYSYIVKFEKKVYRFLFIYYNNGSSIQIYKFSFDDTLELELEESLRVYLN